MAAAGDLICHLSIRKCRLTRKHLACAPIPTASGELFERGRQDAHAERLVVAVGRAWRPRQLNLCVRCRMTARARMSLQQRPQPTERDSETTHGWLCISARTLRRHMIWSSSWGPANWRACCGSGGRRHGRLDLSINISIVFCL